MVGMLSEGICHGAIQIPADGQPIVLMNDRQTIGGYPKIGAVIPADTARLAQLSPGAVVRFEAIGMEQAHNIHCLERARFERTRPLAC
jgi:allophanate hydrolase subunit 2